MGRNRRASTPSLAKGNEPPRLMNINAIMFVATATCGSMPNAIITGTVISDVPSVTTLIKPVRKKIATRISNLLAGIKLLAKLIGFISRVVVFNLEIQKIMYRVQRVVIRRFDPYFAAVR
jgi:hypothetical protein